MRFLKEENASLASVGCILLIESELPIYLNFFNLCFCNYESHTPMTEPCLINGYRSYLKKVPNIRASNITLSTR